MKCMEITKQPDGSWTTEIVDKPYPDAAYEALVQELANKSGAVAVGAQRFKDGEAVVSTEPIVIDLT